MKRLILFGWMLGSCSGLLHADYQKGSQTLAIQMGGAGYSEDFDIHNGENRLRDEGATGGLQYLYFYHSAPTLGLGLDLAWSEFSDRQSSDLLANSESTAESRLAFYQIITKLAYPNGHFRPYLLVGAGLARSGLKSYVSPGPGVTWPDTHTSELRHTFDSVNYGGVFTWGVGMDFFLGKRIFLAAEYRQSLLPRRTHEPTDFGRSQGVEEVREPPALGAVLLKLGYKFGA